MNVGFGVDGFRMNVVLRYVRGGVVLADDVMADVFIDDLVPVPLADIVVPSPAPHVLEGELLELDGPLVQDVVRGVVQPCVLPH